MMYHITEKFRKWWILAAMTCVISMTFIDITVLPVSLPTIQRQLGLSEIGLYWIVNGYILALTVFILAGGRLGDRFGHRTIFMWGLLFFTLGSILCGFSYFQWWFSTSRLIQGVGAALLVPTSASIIFNAFPANQRGKAIGLYVGIGTVFLSLGPFLGGVFSQYFTWRLIFWINIPLAILGFLLTLYAVPNDKGDKKSSFDFIGFFTLTLGISAIVIAFMQVKEWGWFSPWTIGLLIMGIFLIVLLWAVDRKVDDPYIDFSLFRNKTFLGTNVIIFCTQFLLMITVFWSVYFQNAFEFSPAQSGTLGLISNAPLMIVAPLGGHLLDKHGPRIPIILGCLLVISSLLWFLHNIDNKNILILMSAIIPFGCGVPLIFTPTFTTALGEIPAHRRGLASGTTYMLRHLGGTLGLAVMSTLFIKINETQFAQVLKNNVQTASVNPNEFQGLLAKTPAAVQKLQTFAPQTKQFIEQSYLTSYINGFWWINALAIVMAAIGLIFAILLIKKKTQPEIQI